MAAGGSSSRASPARTSMPTQGGESRIIISLARRSGRSTGACFPPEAVTNQSMAKRSQCRRHACLYKSKSRKYRLGGRCRTRRSAVEEAVNGMPQALPIDRLGEMRSEAGRFGRGDITLRSETAESNSTQLSGIAQFAHQIQAATIG